MLTILLLLLFGVALVGSLVLAQASAIRPIPTEDAHRRARRLALLAQAGRRYHPPHITQP